MTLLENQLQSLVDQYGEHVLAQTLARVLFRHAQQRRRDASDHDYQQAIRDNIMRDAILRGTPYAEGDCVGLNTRGADHCYQCAARAVARIEGKGE